MQIKILDKDDLTSDDLIGYCKINLLKEDFLIPTRTAKKQLINI